MDELIQMLKFHGRLAAAEVLGRLMAVHVMQGSAERPKALLPVPLHAKRLAERGFNQSLEIARRMVAGWDLPILDHLVDRVRPTQPQTRQASATARKRNVAGAFRVTGSLAGLSHVALVDDVLTTGATVTELARVLLEGGVRRVDVWACTRAGN